MAQRLIWISRKKDGRLFALSLCDNWTSKKVIVLLGDSLRGLRTVSTLIKGRRNNILEGKYSRKEAGVIFEMKVYKRREGKREGNKTRESYMKLHILTSII